jgi:uncharacterized protein (TIGR02466 family)
MRFQVYPPIAAPYTSKTSSLAVDMQETKLFYSPLWQEDLAATTPDWQTHRELMLNKVYALQQSGEGVKKTNYGGWQSDDEIYVHAEFGWMLNHIMRLSNSVAPAYSPGLNFNNGHIWANVNRKGDFNAVHTHPNSLMSGVVYLKAAGEEQGVIQFFDNREGSPTTHWNCFAPLEERTPFTDDLHAVIPREGMVLFFPSWLRHWVTPNMSDDDRVSLSFNIRSE